MSKDSSRHTVETPLSPYHAPVLSTKADFPFYSLQNLWLLSRLGGVTPLARCRVG